MTGAWQTLNRLPRSRPPTRESGNSNSDSTKPTRRVRTSWPVGQWNAFDITVKGDRATVVLNGKLVIDNAKVPGIPKTGPIALQHHGGMNKKTGKYNPASSLIQFRNVYMKRLEK